MRDESMWNIDFKTFFTILEQTCGMDLFRREQIPCLTSKHVRIPGQVVTTDALHRLCMTHVQTRKCKYRSEIPSRWPYATGMTEQQTSIMHQRGRNSFFGWVFSPPPLTQHKHKWQVWTQNSDWEARTILTLTLITLCSKNSPGNNFMNYLFSASRIRSENFSRMPAGKRVILPDKFGTN